MKRLWGELRGDRLSLFLLAASLAAYLFFSLYRISLPGLQYDELLFVNGALGDYIGPFLAWKFRIGTWSVPLMLMGYIGALKSLIYTPVFLIFGASPASVRVPGILFGLTAILFTIAAVRRMFGTRAAVFAGALLATDPSFLFSCRLDWGPVALMMALKAASLYFLWRWIETGDRVLLVAGSSLLGLGVYDKIIFAWYVAGFAIGLAFCFRRELKRQLTPGTMAVATLAGAAGCLPLIVYNLRRSMDTFRGHGLPEGPWWDAVYYRYGVFCKTLNGEAIFEVVNSLKLDEFATLLSGGGQGILFRIGSIPLPGSLLPALFAGSTVVLLALWGFRKLASGRLALFFVIQLAVILLFICLSAEATGPHHTILVYPVPHIIVACCVSQLIQWTKKSDRLPGLIAGSAAWLSLVAVLGSQVVINSRYLWSFEAGGGTGSWSDAIYDLVNFAKAHPEKEFLLMDWGFRNQFRLLGGPGLKMNEAFIPVVDAPEHEKLDRMRTWVRVPEAVFVFHEPPATKYPLLDLFRDAAASERREVREIRTFSGRGGRIVYRLFATSPGMGDSYLFLKREPGWAILTFPGGLP
jgi:4-amino-4-deoxy-L-arabinose transferase-like glycosyltransferase